MNYQITTERADLFDINMIIGMQISVNGMATNEEIKTAFQNAVKCHEILNTKVRIEKDGKAYYIPNSKNRNAVFFTELDLQVLFKQQEKIRFKVEKGEYLRLFVKQQENGFTALFLMHHLAGDGKSLSYFIETFMRTLNYESVEFSPISLLSTDELSKVCKLPALAKLITFHYNKIWSKEKTVFTFEKLQNSYNAFWRDNETEIVIKSYSKENVEQMKNEAKDIGCHLTAYMITKYLLEKKTIQYIGLAVDGRLDKNRSMGNQATGITIKTKYNFNRTFAENALRIQKMLDRKLKNPLYKYFILNFMAEFDPTLIDAINLQFTGTFNSDSSRKLAKLLGYGENTNDLSLTNLTVLDIPNCYRNYEIEKVLFIPPVVSYGKNVVGIVTHNGEMTVVIHKYIS